MASTSEVLTLERDEHVATLWLDSPERRNAMGPALWADLPGMMDEVSEDDEVRAASSACAHVRRDIGLDAE